LTGDSLNATLIKRVGMDVIGLGALNVDLIYEVDDRLPGIEPGRERAGSQGELRRLRSILRKKGRLKCRSGGGSAANTIYTLAKMGFQCGFTGKVGLDEEGNFLLDELNGVGVDTVRIKREGESGFCLILLQKGERSIIIYPNVNDDFRLEENDVSYLNQATFVHITSFVGETAFRHQMRAVSQIEAKISFDPGEPHISRGFDELRPIFRRSFIVFPTGREVEILTGQDYRKGAHKLIECGVGIVVCTLGDKGCYLLSRKGEWEVPSPRVEVKDTTGAGDVFAAGFLSGLLQGLSLLDCANLATRAATFSLGTYGRGRYPDERFLLDYLGQEVLSSDPLRGK